MSSQRTRPPLCTLSLGASMYESARPIRSIEGGSAQVGCFAFTLVRGRVGWKHGIDIDHEVWRVPSLNHGARTIILK